MHNIAIKSQLQLVREKLSSERIDEGEAARKLLVLVGPRIEMAVAVAAGLSNASETVNRIRNTPDQGRHSVVEPNRVQAVTISKAATRRSLTCSWSAKLLSSTSPVMS